MRTSPDRWIRIRADMYVEMAGLCLSFCYVNLSFLWAVCTCSIISYQQRQAEISTVDGGGLERN